MHTPRRFVMPLGIAILSALLAGCIVITAPRPAGTGPSPEADGQDAPSSTATATATPLPGAASTPPPSAAPTSSPHGAGDVECGDGGAPTLSGNDRTFQVAGTCTELTVVGDGLVVDASAAAIGTLRISGDRVSVRFPAADAVIVKGDDASLTSAAGIGRLDIEGDRTTTEATTGIPSVTVRGRDNTVRSGAGVGSAVVAGSGNTIR